MSDSNNKISRRNFLITVLAASGASFFAGSIWRYWEVEDAVKALSNPVSSQRLDTLLSEISKSAGIIGREYINKYAADVSKSELIAEINTKLADQELTTDMFYKVKERIKKQILTDFDHSEFVEVGNWVISRTEAQICAVVYLSG